VPAIIPRAHSGSHPIKIGELANMSVDAKAEIVIERPRSEVAKIMFDPKCDKLWIGGLTNVFPLTSGLLKTGSRVNRDGSFHGRQYSAQVLVVKDEPDKMLELSSDEPFELKTKYELEDVDGGTRVKLRVQGIVEHQYKMPPVAFTKLVAESLNNDLKKLKRHAEM
jgi:hypothetical protein